MLEQAHHYRTYSMIPFDHQNLAKPRKFDQLYFQLLSELEWYPIIASALFVAPLRKVYHPSQMFEIPPVAPV